MADRLADIASQIDELFTITGTLGNHQEYAVGDIYLTFRTQNPNTIKGYGSWQLVAKGQTIMGIDTTQTEFATNRQTGGEKSHTLTVAEMPSHSHLLKWRVSFPRGTASLVTNDFRGDAVLVSDSMPGGNSSSGYDWSGGRAGLDNTGGGGSHNNLPPYIVCYIWERIA